MSRSCSRRPRSSGNVFTSSRGGCEPEPTTRRRIGEMRPAFTHIKSLSLRFRHGLQVQGTPRRDRLGSQDRGSQRPHDHQRQGSQQVGMALRPDYRSAEAAQYRTWYKGRAWQAIRRQQLTTEPLCRMCQAEGRVTAATVCDHVEPHRGNWDRFIGGPFQSLCKPHHDGAKQSEEHHGFSTSVGADGWPTDSRHPANRRTARFAR